MTMMAPTNGKSNGANGATNGKARALIGPAKTLSYKPVDDRWFRRPRDLPPFDFWAIQAMLMEPTVRLGLAMRAAPLMAAEFAYKEGEEWKPGLQCEDEVVGEFVLRQLKTIWQQLDLLVSDQIWGWCAGEVTYRLTERNMVEIDKVLPRAASDTRLLERDCQPFGVRISKVEEATGGFVDLPFPFAFFHAHRPQAGKHYGDSILEGAYSPWADKWLEGGALGVRRKFMFKDAYGGVDVGYPSGTTQVGEEAIDNKDIAKEIAEQLESGGVTYRPSEMDENGKEKWPLTRATVPSNPQHILQFPKDLDTEILRGLEIPDDVLESTDGAGGAWAGKTVPQGAFFNGLETWLRCKLRAIKPTIDYLIFLNFGRKYWYEVTTKPLALQAMEQQGEKGGKGQPGQPGQSPFGQQQQQPGQQGMQQQGPQQGGQQPMPPQHQLYGQQQRMSLDPVQAVGEGVLNAAELVKAARDVMATRLSADFKESEHPRNEDGEFAKGGKGGKNSGMDIKKIVADVESGKISRSAVRKQHGDEAYFAVNKHLKDKRDAAESAPYVPTEEDRAEEERASQIAAREQEEQESRDAEELQKLEAKKASEKEDDARRRDEKQVRSFLRDDSKQASAELQRGTTDRQERRSLHAAIQMPDAHDAMLKAGWEFEYQSKSGSLYYRKGEQKARLADHAVPATAEREHNKGQGGFTWADSDSEIILPVDDVAEAVEEFS